MARMTGTEGEIVAPILDQDTGTIETIPMRACTTTHTAAKATVEAGMAMMTTITMMAVEGDHAARTAVIAAA
jgi:hypothetical protein